MEPREGIGYDFDDFELFEMINQEMVGKLSKRVPQGPARAADALVAARLAARRADALVGEKLAAIEAFGADEFPEGTVIRFDRTMPNRKREPQRYMYAAIKVEGHWYTTGTKGQRYTWDELLVWLVSGGHPTRTFEVATKWSEWASAKQVAPPPEIDDSLPGIVCGNRE
jgi:hypothetical protein